MRIPLVAWIMVALVGANLALYWWQGQEPERVPPPLDLGLPRLVLLKEAAAPVTESALEPQAESALEPELEDQVPSERASSIGARLATEIEDTIEQDVDAESRTETGPEVEYDPEAESAPIAEQGGESDARAEVEPDAAPDREPDSESESESESEPEAELELEPEPEPESEPDRSCWLAGPLVSSTQYGVLGELFEQRGARFQIEVLEIPERTDYWVYLPVEEGDSALERSRALRSAGLDNFIISAGELEGNISLGLFSTEDRARIFIGQLERLGHEAFQAPRVRYREESWLFLRGFELNALGWPVGEGEVPNQGGLELRASDCPDT